MKTFVAVIRELERHKEPWLTSMNKWLPPGTLVVAQPAPRAGKWFVQEDEELLATVLPWTVDKSSIEILGEL